MFIIRFQKFVVRISRHPAFWVSLVPAYGLEFFSPFIVISTMGPHVAFPWLVPAVANVIRHGLPLLTSETHYDGDAVVVSLKRGSKLIATVYDDEFGVIVKVGPWTWGQSS